MVDRCKINNYKVTTRTTNDMGYKNSIIKITHLNGKKLNEDDVLSFLTLISLTDYVSFLENLINENNFQFYEYGGISFGPLEESIFDNIKKIESNNVRIGVYGNYLDILKKDLLLFGLKFSFAVLEAVTWFDLLEKGIVDKQWVCEVKQWILDNEENILKMQEDE